MAMQDANGPRKGKCDYEIPLYGLCFTVLDERNIVIIVNRFYR